MTYILNGSCYDNFGMESVVLGRQPYIRGSQSKLVVVIQVSLFLLCFCSSLSVLLSVILSGLVYGCSSVQPMYAMYAMFNAVSNCLDVYLFFKIFMIVSSIWGSYDFK